MVTLTGNITDVTGRTPDSISSITVKAPSARIGGGSDIIVTSPAKATLNKTTGSITISGLHVGLSWLYIEGDGWSDSIPLAVAEGFQLILEAVANASGVPGIADYLAMIRSSGDHARLLAAAAVDGEIGEVVRLSQTAAQTAAQAATASEQAAIHADIRATSAETKVDEHTSRVEALEAMSGLSPESPVDGQTANLIGQPDTLTRAALMDAGSEAFLAKRTPVYSQFVNVPDGTRPTHTDSGHEWAYVSPQGQEVRNGNLRSVVGDFGTHPHAEIQMGENITRMGARFRFSSEGGTRSGDVGIALVAWGDGGLTSPGGLKKTRAHVDLTPTSCGLSVSEHSAPNWGLSVIGGRYTFPKRLEFDTWYTLEFYIMGDSAAIVMPDGYVHVVSDPRIGSIESTTADFELNQIPTGNNAAIPEFREVWADATPALADGGIAPAFQALQGLGKASDSVVRYNDALKFRTLEGDPTPVMSLDSAGHLSISNGLATESRAEVRLRKDGLIDVVRGGVVRISVNEDGDLYPRKIVFSSSKHSLTMGSGSPEGVVDQPVGSLYIQYNGAFGQFLWVRERAVPGNGGWRPVGHPANTTALRPSTPIVGLSYFDTTLGKPIWWNGTAWVDAAGEPV